MEPYVAHTSVTMPVSIVNYKLKQFFLLSFDAMYYGKLESKVIEIETVLFNCVKSK